MPGEQMWALIRAFLIAPLVTPFLFVALKASQGFSQTDLRAALVDFADGFLMFALIAYVAAVLLGIPLFWMYQKLGIRSMLGYLAGGFLVGLITMIGLGLITGGLFRGDYSLSALVRTTLVLLGSGGGSGIVFRILVFGR